MTEHIPYRQIHLDFHTSPEIPGVGQRFDRAEFGKTLRDAHVNSINLFTKCHHGMYTYPTKVGTMHPNLAFDLFGEQLKACRENNIRAIAYTCVAWNEDWANRHPEWLCFTYDGLRGNKLPFEKGFTKWNSLCILHPDYRAVMRDELREVYENYHPDGFWIDIIQTYQCVCPVCQADMRARGMDPTDRAAVIRHDHMAQIDYCREFYGFLKGLDPALDVYFNSHPYAMDNALDPETSSVTKRKYFSFIDIESLPSDDWGYTHFPIAVNYVDKYDQELCMMNGKFHFSWADFGSLRNREALEYECFRALSYGTRVCVGDQLHPCGKLDPVVYARIGDVFASIERKEPWLRGTRKLRDVGVFITGAQGGSLVEEGVYAVLSELHIPFDFVNGTDPLDSYKLLVLPDDFEPDPALAARINAFVRDGGKALITGRSGVSGDTGKFLLDFVKADFLGESPYDNRYLRLDPDVFPDVPAIDHILYERGCVVSSKERAVATTVNPYFNRTYDHFCSHRQTPPMPESSGEPGILLGEGYIYVTARLFTDYIRSRYQAHRGILAQCFALLLERPLIRTELPAITELVLRESSEMYVLHLLNYVIQRKSKRLDTIEERFIVPAAGVRVRMDAAPREVRLVPENTPLPFVYEDGYASVDLAGISGHTMIAFVK